MARVEALAQRLGQSHHVDVPHAGREWAVSTVEHRVRPVGAAVLDGKGVQAPVPRRRVRVGVEHHEGVEAAIERADKDAGMTLDEWQAEHSEKVESILAELGYQQD